MTGIEGATNFTGGLNIITGPITTGKTTLIRLCKALLGSRITPFPVEVAANSSSVAGDILLGSQRFSIVRPLVSTQSAVVEVAGERTVDRMPALRAEVAFPKTYGQWLLDQLDLPRIQVPSAPTRPESEPTPITINDYMMYCDLEQGEIDNSVFGHHDVFKNIKRKYVFEIIYGVYGVETALIQEQLREVELRIRSLRADRVVLERLLQDTPWSNRAELERQLREAEEELVSTTDAFISTGETATLSSSGAELRQELISIESALAEAEAAVVSERTVTSKLEDLVSQLRSQTGRLTKAIVADSLLLDFEFVTCPRCNSALDQGRAGVGRCLLCLQEPSPAASREDLVREQQRVNLQVEETLELVKKHRLTSEELQKTIEALSRRRVEVARELDVATRSYISDSGALIARTSERRARTRERVQRLSDYLRLFARFDESALELSDLEQTHGVLMDRLGEHRRHSDEVRRRIEVLNNNFRAILARFNTPRFERVSDISRIDNQTYLPILYGRRFDDLSSQGLKVIVNVAHALAHQLTCISEGLKLPNILFIDGLTSNIGHEGLDRDRVQAIYDYLIELSDGLGDQLQFIVADNDVPSGAQGFVRVAFSEEDRLIPSRLLNRDA